MKVKAKAEYAQLKENENFIALGSTSTHLRLLANIEVEISKQHLPLPKAILKTLTEIKADKKSEVK